MAVWFTQNRSDINRLSTKALIEWAKAEVDTARHFVRVDNPEGSSTDMLRSARWAVEMVFDDGPAAVVMGEGGLSRATAVPALNGWFDTVISGFEQAIRAGFERELPAGAALAAPSIQREVAGDAALSAQSKASALNRFPKRWKRPGNRLVLRKSGL